MSTVLVNYHNDFDPYKATSTPIYQTATFKMKSATEFGEYGYSRNANPTRDTLEKLLAQLDNADKAFCFTSGMTALTAVCELVNPGDEIIAVEDIYGGSYKFLNELIARKEGVKVTKVDTSNLENVEAAMGINTKLIWLESPSNPQLKICDIRRISEIAHAHGAIVLVDNSAMSPVLSQPLDLGADIVMHSNTKFVAGNSSVLAGSLATRDEGLAKHLEAFKNTTGTALSPFDSWLCLEGIKTMALRVKEKQKNAQIVAEFLASHPQVTKIMYPGLSSHPGYDLHHSQANGPGSVLSFTTGSLPLSKHIVESTEYFSMTVSFGSVSSSICLPWYTSHAVIPEGERVRMGLTKDLVRISVGIEDVSDLITDLDKALSFGSL
ncbi:cystathionine beta-lyase, chloroplastic-like isoform X2 [Neltuma alba]|nr:cystathionine beta-lyase, chloroplastic-like isoform X2 [Prosopis alba]